MLPVSPPPQPPKLNAVLSTMLGGCTQELISADKNLIKVCVLGLLLCEDHGGVHHFAVIREGKSVVMSEVGVACLRGQGIEID